LNYHKYIHSLGLYNIKDEGTRFAFRCPFCGGSKDKPNHRQAFILNLGDKPYFYCHKCGHVCEPNNGFSSFLKELNYSIYQQYLTDLRKEFISTSFREEIKTITISTREHIPETVFTKFLTNIALLDENHPAVVYLNSRKIPKSHFKNLYYFAGNPFTFYNKVFDRKKYSQSSSFMFEGILVPFVNSDGNTLGFGLRLLKTIGGMRFFNLFESEKEFMFGEDKINKYSELFVLEGMMDKLSLENSNFISMLSTNPKINHISDISKSTATYIFDNEYLNTYIQRNIQKVGRRHSVFLWDSNFSHAKDVNDLVVKYDMKENDIVEYIKKNTFSGMMLNIEFKKRFNNYLERVFYV
jgi:hypothetical protein